LISTFEVKESALCMQLPIESTAKSPPEVLWNDKNAYPDKAQELKTTRLTINLGKRERAARRLWHNRRGDYKKGGVPILHSCLEEGNPERNVQKGPGRGIK
jgi:hypothetical protein